MVQNAQATIKFRNLEINPVRVEVDVEYEAGTFRLFYEFDRRVPTSSTLVALALSTLCGTRFDRVSFDFEVEESALETIRGFTRAVVQAIGTSDSRRQTYRGGNVLSFSGGFDSMAALALMPDDTHLVSIDFGGWFTREADFFARFEPLTVSTNIRRVPDQRTALARNHWTFMTTGAILAHDYFAAEYHTFGTILGGTFAQSMPGERRVPLLDAAGYKDAPYTNGITEVGTAKILLKARPDLVTDSIASLAGKGDRKRFLKIALTTLMNERLGGRADIPALPEEWDRKIPFNDSYTTSLGALYFFACDRAEFIEPLFSEIPEDAVEFARTHDFSFMEKVNLDHSAHLPAELWADFQVKLDSFGIRPYSEKDWEEVKAVRDYLAQVF